MKRRLEENKSTPNIRRWRWIDHMKETENFHHPAGTPLEPTGEQTEWKTREHPSSQTTVLSPQTSSNDDRENRCGSHMGYR